MKRATFEFSTRMYFFFKNRAGQLTSSRSKLSTSDGELPLSSTLLITSLAQIRADWSSPFYTPSDVIKIACIFLSVKSISSAPLFIKALRKQCVCDCYYILRARRFESIHFAKKHPKQNKTENWPGYKESSGKYEKIQPCRSGMFGILRGSRKYSELIRTYFRAIRKTSDMFGNIFEALPNIMNSGQRMFLWPRKMAESCSRIWVKTRRVKRSQ